jgi:replicative DNA helicase
MSDEDFKANRKKKAELADPSRVDRFPPYSTEAEQGVLGCILLSPAECVTQLTEMKIAGHHFYDLRHQAIYDVILELWDENQGRTGDGIDVITIRERLLQAQNLEEVGGLAYLASLPDAVPSAANLLYYVDIVRRCYVLRRLIALCSEVAGRAYDYTGEAEELLDKVEKDMMRIGQDLQNESDLIDARELMKRTITLVEAMQTKKDTTFGLPSGFADLDKMTNGFHNGEMIVIAARPSCGKTSIAMNIAEFLSVDKNIPVGVFSLEMSAEQLGMKLLCSRARVNLHNISTSILSERDCQKMVTAGGKIGKSPLYIDDSSGLSILQLRAKARRMVQQFGVKLFVIDYLQLLHSTKKTVDNRQQEIADISCGVKALAKELDVPVIALAQLNRESEKNNRKPRMSDLRESGAIEQDADFVGLLYKPTVEEDSAQVEPTCVPVNLLIAKQRNGPTGDIAFTFIKPYTRFESAAKISDEDVPHQQSAFPDP